MPLGRIAELLRGLPGYGFPPGVSAGLEASHMFRIDALAYANAVHVCEVAVDIDTGTVHIQRYVALHDCGELINPLGIKGVAEAGIVCVGSVIASAVENALEDYKVRITDLPIMPAKLLAAIDAGLNARESCRPE